MIFWIVAIVLVLIVLAALLLPMMRGGDDAVAAAEYDLAVYRDQLAQVDTELRQGTISDSEAAAARTEIGRRILNADAQRQQAGDTSKRGQAGAPAIAVTLGILLPVAAIALYVNLGAPGLPSFPFAERGGATAERTAELQTMAARLAQQLEENPDNVEGWVLLARTQMQLRNFAKAAGAYEKALGLDDGNAVLTAAYGEALTLAAGGTVTPAARAAFEATLKKAPDDPRARFYLALADSQAGNHRAALDGWVALLKDAPPNAPWAVATREQASKAATALGLEPEEVLPPLPDAPKGPSEQDMAAAQNMTPQERQAMIESMVQGLADRLKEDPDDLPGWLRLARAYTVQERYADARDAMAKAADLAPENVNVLLLYGRALRSAAGNEQTPDSVAVMRQVLKLDPDNTEALWLAGRADVEAGQREAGIAMMQRALDSLPKDAAERQQLQAHLDALKAKKE